MLILACDVTAQTEWTKTCIYSLYIFYRLLFYYHIPQEEEWDRTKCINVIKSKQKTILSTVKNRETKSVFQGASAHLFDGEIIDEVVVVLVEAAVQGYTVRVDEQVLQSGHALQAERALHAIRKVGVIEDHAKTEGLSPQSHRLANTPWNTKTNSKFRPQSIMFVWTSTIKLGLNRSFQVICRIWQEFEGSPKRQLGKAWYCFFNEAALQETLCFPQR